MLTGDLSSLQVLSQALIILDLYYCPEVTGDLHALTLFPCLERLKVFGTNVTGDVRKIESTAFPCLKEIQLGNHVFGRRTIKMPLQLRKRGIGGFCRSCFFLLKIGWHISGNFGIESRRCGILR